MANALSSASGPKQALFSSSSSSSLPDFVLHEPSVFSSKI